MLGDAEGSNVSVEVVARFATVPEGVFRKIESFAKSEFERVTVIKAPPFSASVMKVIVPSESVGFVFSLSEEFVK